MALNKKHSQLALLLGVSLLLFIAFTQNAGTTKYPASEALRSNFFTQLHTEVDTFSILIQAKAPADELIEHFKKCRRAYKQTEPYMYTHQGFEPFENKINSPSFGYGTSGKGTYEWSEGRGFQKIEEMLFADSLDYAALQVQTHELKVALQQFEDYAGKQISSASYIVLSVQNELLQLYGRGFSGYDVPMVQTQLSECANALKACSQMLEALQKDLAAQDIAAGKKYKEATKHLNQSIKALQKSADAESFNYGEYFNTHLLPLTVYLQQGLSELPPSVKNTVYTRTDVNFSVPVHSAGFFVQRIDTAYANLGRLFFFDPVMSGNVQRTCASCHKPGMAFTDGRVTALSVDEKPLQRNTPSLINAMLQRSFQLDGRSFSISDQANMVLFSAHEMANTSRQQLLNRIGSIPHYRQKMNALTGGRIYDTKGVAVDTIRGMSLLGECLSQYVLSLQAINAPYDTLMQGPQKLPAVVAAGINLFYGKAKCATCHFAPVFSGLVPPWFNENEVEVLGITTDAHFEQAVLDADAGLYHASGLPQHMHAFKTQSLRNTEFTAPYMHNGSLATLDELLGFYAAGGGAGMGLDVPNQTLPADSLALQPDEKENLKTFMQLLNSKMNIAVPPYLPAGDTGLLQNRKVSGVY